MSSKIKRSKVTDYAALTLDILGPTRHFGLVQDGRRD